GVLTIQNANALSGNTPSTPTTTTVLDGAQLQIQGGITTSAASALRLSGTGVFGSGALKNVSGANKWEGAVTLAQDPGFSPKTSPGTNAFINVLAANAADSLTIDGAITQDLASANPLGLTKIGPGLLVLNNNQSSYGGVTNVNAGVLRIQKSNALGT